MKRAILATLLAAGTLLSAAPALAQESAPHGRAISAPAQLSPRINSLLQALT